MYFTHKSVKKCEILDILSALCQSFFFNVHVERDLVHEREPVLTLSFFFLQKMLALGNKLQLALVFLKKWNAGTLL